MTKVSRSSKTSVYCVYMYGLLYFCDTVALQANLIVCETASLCKLTTSLLAVK